MYDQIVNTLILVVDLGILWVVWEDRTRKHKARNARKFNKILQSIGLR